MTIINPNSIAGITSVTAEAGVMNFYKSDGTLAGLQLNGVNFNTTAGVSTFNNLYVGGVLTYEDVKNVDSVGIITARTGIAIPNDTYKLRSGTDLEMQVWHDGTNSIIKDTRNSGKVRIQADNFDIIDKDASETMLSATVDGAVSLNYNGSTKLATTNTGVSITGIPVATQTTGNVGLELHATGSGRGSQTKYHNDHGVQYVGTAGDTTGNLLIWQESNANIFFATNNTERLRIDSNGRLLLGTTTEGHGNADDLTVATSGNTGITIRSGTSNGGNIFFSDATSGTGEYAGMISYDHNDNIMTFHTTDGSERLRITSTGQLLLGINNAVSSDINFQIHSASSGVGPILNMTNNTGDCRIFFGQDSSSSSANAQGQIRYNVASNYLAAYTTGSERFRITGAGLVGINQTSIYAGLHIKSHTNGWQGGILLEEENDAKGWNIHPDNNDNLMFGRNTNLASNTVSHKFQIKSNGDVEILLGDLVISDKIVHIGDTDTAIRFPAADTVSFETAGSERLRINSSGRVMFGPDAQDIQLIPHSTNSGHGQIYFRGNASNESSSIKLNHYGHADYVIGAGRHSNGTFSITRTDGGTDGLLMNSSGRIKIGGSPEALTGNGVNAKLQVNNVSNDYDGIMIGGGYNRSTINTGANYDLVLTSNAYPANATSYGIRFKCGSSGGGGPNERMRIYSEGYVTKPAQPRFMAYRGSSSITNISNGTITGWNNVKYDVGSNFSNGTKFTAPVTGTYMFGCTIRWGCSGKIRVIRVQLDHLNSSNGGKGNYGGGIGGANDYDGSSGYDHPYTSFTNLVEMDAGDYVQIALAEVAHSGQLDLQAQGFVSNFWGCLMF